MCAAHPDTARSYLSLDNGALREDAVKDVGALIVWLGLQSAFDAKHVVVSGVGYGGYLALAALVNYGDRLRGGVDLAGITDFVSFLSNTAPYRQDQRRAEYGDERDPDTRAFLRRISPLTNADRIARPLLLVHGKNDPRVPDQRGRTNALSRCAAGAAWSGICRPRTRDTGFARSRTAMRITARSRSS